MKLIDNWRQALRFNSVQLALLLAFLSSVQADVLPLLQPIFPQKWWPLIVAAQALAIALLRLRMQPDIHPDINEQKEPRP